MPRNAIGVSSSSCQPAETRNVKKKGEKKVQLTLLTMRWNLFSLPVVLLLVCFWLASSIASVRNEPVNPPADKPTPKMKLLP